MTATVIMRRIMPPDLPAIRALFDRTPPAGAGAAAESWPASLADIPRNFAAFWVADLGGEVVGMLGLSDAARGKAAGDVPEFIHTSGRVGRIEYLRVAPERQHDDIDQQLAQQAIDWGREIGLDALIIETTPREDAAGAPYEGLGFTEVGRSRNGDRDLAWLQLQL